MTMKKKHHRHRHPHDPQHEKGEKSKKKKGKKTKGIVLPLLPGQKQDAPRFVIMLNMQDQFLGLLDAQTAQFVDATLVRVQPPSKRERHEEYDGYANGDTDGGGSGDEYDSMPPPPLSSLSLLATSSSSSSKVASASQDEEEEGAPFSACLYQPMRVAMLSQGLGDNDGDSDNDDDDDDEEDGNDGQPPPEDDTSSAQQPPFPAPEQLLTDEERRMHDRALQESEMRRDEDAAMHAEQSAAEGSAARSGLDIHSDRNGPRGGGGFGGGGGGARIAPGFRSSPSFRAAPTVRTMPFRAAPLRTVPFRTVPGRSISFRTTPMVSPRLAPSFRTGPRFAPSVRTQPFVSPRLAPFRRGLTRPLIAPSYAFSRINPFRRTSFGWPYYRWWVPFLPFWFAAHAVPWALWYPYPRYIYVLPSDRVFMSGGGFPITLPTLPVIPIGMTPDDVSAMLQQLRSQFPLLIAEGYDVVPYFYGEGRPGQFVWIRHRNIPFGAQTYGAPASAIV
jgi:hypothetical protein